MTAVVVDLGLERLVHIDRRIDASESSALRDRWEKPDPLEVLTFPNPSGWQPITRAEFKQWLTEWVNTAEGRAAA